jgi:hypothetical protein
MHFLQTLEVLAPNAKKNLFLKNAKPLQVKFRFILQKRWSRHQNLLQSYD